MLNNLLHRGAAGADAGTGDGAGILIQMPHRFFKTACRSLGFSLPSAGRYGAAMMFMPLEPEAQMACRAVVDKALAHEGLRVLGWREVPTDPDALGESARATRPSVWQCFTDSAGLVEEALERKLYVARRQCERAVADTLGTDTRFYVPSFSGRTVIYKGLMMATEIPAFYLDLNEPLLRERARRRAPALQHQHLPLVGARAAVPLHGAQRRDQHPARQPQLDPLAPVGAGVRPVRRRPQEAAADHRRARQRLRLPRQRARVAHDRRPRHPTRHAHAHPPGVGREVPHGPRSAGILRVPRGSDGAVGRARGGGVQRRSCGRSDARPQRAEAGALHHHQGRLHGARLRGGRARLSA